MKVICVSTNSVYGRLTVDKVYVISYNLYSWYEIIDDNGYLSCFPKDLFIKLAEFRQSQIDSIF